MAFTLPELPYDRIALEPYISGQTLDYHHGKHHAAYITNLNKLLDGHALENKSLEEVIIEAAGKPDLAGIFNNAAQIWNHTFYWHSMKPNGGKAPTGRIKNLIETSFGNYEGFINAFKTAGATQFGSGWAWLVSNGQKLSVLKTGNAETPITQKGIIPLLTMDVWEHAYYLDYQNKRPSYIETFLEHLLNWDFVEKNLEQA